MKLLCHFAVVGLSNTYLIGPSEGGDAILVDPSGFNSHLLNMIESNGFYIKSILVTHNHDNHIRGISTTLKIYEADIYSASKEILGYPSNEISDGEKLNLNGIKITPMEIRGHSSDSLVFHIGNYLFTGDILSAGRIGTASNTWGQANLYKDIQDKILPLPGKTMILPGHGPPSTLEIEKLVNLDIVTDEDEDPILPTA